MSGAGDLRRDIEEYLSKRNKKSSFWMALANLIVGSPINNMRYLLAKLSKGRERK